MEGNNKAAVFLDRDGTIIEDNGYLRDPSEVIFFPETFEALQKLQKKYQLFIVTNQSGIAKGILSRNEVEAVNNYIVAVLGKREIDITEVYVCPHRKEDGCECMKPKSFFLERSAAMYSIDLHGSYSAGDHPCDVELAQSVGGRGVYVLTGHGKEHEKQLPYETPIMPNIKAAADWIIRNADIAR